MAQDMVFERLDVLDLTLANLAQDTGLDQRLDRPLNRPLSRFQLARHPGF
jgi:hypothetical protein